MIVVEVVLVLMADFIRMRHDDKRESLEGENLEEVK